MKVLTLVGTRPELIKLSAVIEALDKAVDHVLVHTGQNYDYELNQVFFDEMEIRKPNHFLGIQGKNAADTIAQVISKTDDILEKENPDAFLIYGDTNSCVGAIAAKKRKIPVFHMEAGNRCFDQNVPEEINRKIIDHISDINMVISEHARRYLLNEGIKGESILKTGSSMTEVLNKHKDKINNANPLEKMGLTKEGFILFSAHREELVDREDKLSQMLAVLTSLHEEFQKPIVFTTHPRTRKRLEKMGVKWEDYPFVQFLKPFGFFDYIQLQKQSFCVVSDSGTISEESSILGFPAVTLRETHERPEAMDEGTLIMTGLREKDVVLAIKTTKQMFEESQGRPFEVVEDYATKKVSDKVVKAILSYTHHINRYVWRKD